MPFRQLHFNANAFGQDVNAFNPERFLDRDLLKSASWRPYGGGATLCPGRFLARREVYMFVATVMRRFEMEMLNDDGKRKFPRLDLGTPVNGMMGPKAGDDVVVRIRRADL